MQTCNIPSSYKSTHTQEITRFHVRRVPSRQLYRQAAYMCLHAPLELVGLHRSRGDSLEALGRGEIVGDELVKASMIGHCTQLAVVALAFYRSGFRSCEGASALEQVR